MRGLLSPQARSRFAQCVEQVGVIAQVRAYYLIRMAAQDHFRALSRAHGAAWMRHVAEQCGWVSSELGWPEPDSDRVLGLLAPPGRLATIAQIAYCRAIIASLLRLRRAMMDSLAFLAARHGSEVAVAAMSAAGGWDNWIMGPQTVLSVSPAGAN